MRIIKQENESKGAFIALVDTQEAGRMTYSLAGADKMIIDHTEVNDEYRGQGVGDQLLEAAIQMARTQNLKVIPLCRFAKSRFDKRDDLDDLKY